MSLLSPDLRQAILDFLLAYDELLLPKGRIGILKPALSGWDGIHQVNWEGSIYVFCNHFLEITPGEWLKKALRAMPSGVDAAPTVAALCQRIDADAQRATAVPADALSRYYQEQIKLLSGSRYQIDNRFVQLTLLVDQGPDAQGLRFVPDERRGKYNSLQKLLAEVQERALVLLGRPGCGKTTLLRRLQLERAWAGPEVAGGKIPFFVPLNSYRGARLADPPPDPAAWLAQQWQQQQPDLPDFAGLLGKGRLLLLLDGLNEMPHRDRDDFEERVALWRLFVRRAAPLGNTLLFSCRSLDYSVSLDSEAQPVRQVDVEPLTSAQIEQFLTLYLGKEAEEVWAALRQDSQQLTLFATPFFLRLLVDQKLLSGELLTSRVALLTGFVRRALYRELEERHQRLFSPGQLLTASDGQQVRQNKWATPMDLPQQGALIPRLAALAYAMQDGRAADEAGQIRIPEETAYALLDHPLAAEIVAAGVQLNVLDLDMTRQEITYLHQLLQEYFAARILAGRPEPGRVQSAWRADELQPRLTSWLQQADVSTPLPPAPTTGWEETTVLAAALTPNPEQFVRDLMAANLPLAARCAAVPEITAAVPPGLLAELQEALLARIGDGRADLRARIAAAEALGDLGDPRFERRSGKYGDYLLPPLVTVAGGSYRIGSEERTGCNLLWRALRRRQTTAYAQEKPAHEVAISPFEMAVFPVTNAEYALFMAAGGYEDERWWETEAARAWLRGESGSEAQKQAVRDEQVYIRGFSEEVLRKQKVSPEQLDYWLWLKNVEPEEMERVLESNFASGEVYRQPRFWEDGRFNHSSRPVVGITWFEARAYCVWLSAQTGDRYRLPTEVEWEAAARGQARREYAFGERYDPGRCNTFETHIRRTTPVGVFPGGKTPEGIYDLSGNVWEWTSTIWGKSRNKPDYPYPYDGKDGREDPEDGTSRRVLRGGSFHYNADDARAAYRLSLVPGPRDYDLGFRVVVVRRSPSHHPDH